MISNPNFNPTQNRGFLAFIESCAVFLFVCATNSGTATCGATNEALSALCFIAVLSISGCTTLCATETGTTAEGTEVVTTVVVVMEVGVVVVVVVVVVAGKFVYLQPLIKLLL